MAPKLTIFVLEIGFFISCVFLVDINWLEYIDFMLLVLLDKLCLTRKMTPIFYYN